jgi:excisionase family DNA binding protein
MMEKTHDDKVNDSSGGSPYPKDSDVNGFLGPSLFLTAKQLAGLLQITEMTIYRLARRGELPYHSIGRVKRFRRSDVEQFLNRCRVDPSEIQGHR